MNNANKTALILFIIFFSGAVFSGFAQDPADADSLMERGSDLYYKGRYENALILFERARDIDRELNDERLMNLGFDYGWIGECNKMLERIPEAMENYDKARNVLNEAGQELYASIYSGNLGWLYKEQGEMDRAFELISDAYRMGEEYEQPEYISIWASHLAEIHEHWGDIPAAVEKNRRAYEVAEDSQMETQQYIVGNNLANQLWELERGDEAEGYYVKSLEIARSCRWQDEVDKQLDNLINLNQELRDFQEAMDYAQDGYNGARRDKTLKEKYLSSLGDISMQIEEYGSAEEYFIRALKLARAADNKDRIAINCNNLGKTYSDWGRPEEALLYFEEALAIGGELDDPDNLATYLNNVGSVYHHVGDYRKAVEYYEEALDIDVGRGNMQDIAIGYNNISSVFDAWGRYDIAVEYLEKALKISRDYDLPEEEATFLNNIGLIFLAWGDFQTAIDYCEQALTIAEEYEMRSAQGRYHSNIGLNLVEMEQYEEALDHFLYSKEISESMQNDWELAVDLNNIGAVYSSLGDNDSAVEYYSDALEIAERLNQRDRQSAYLNNIGKILEEEGKRKEAVNYYKQALTLAEEMDLKDEMTVYHTNIGSVYFELKNYRMAEEYFLMSIRLLEDLRLTAPGKIRRDYLASQIHNYRWLVLTYLEEGKPDRAFDIAELASAKYLAEQIGETMDEEELKFSGIEMYAGQLDDRTAVVNIVELNGPRFAVLVATNTEILGKEVQLDNFLSGINIDYGENITLRLSQLPTRGVRRVVEDRGIRQRTEDGGAPGGPERGKLDFVELIQYYRYLLSNPALRSSEQQIFINIAEGLYRNLLGPFAGILSGKENLIILPDGPLALIPFETLQQPNGAYLAEEYNIRYAQSLTVLELISAREYAEIRKPLLAFGGAVYDPRKYDIDMVQSEQHLKEMREEAVALVSRGGDAREVYSSVGIADWSNLPGSLAEVRAIEDIVHGSTVYSGADVSEEFVKSLSVSGELAEYKQIHFATHGVVVPEIPELSAVVLSQFQEDSSGSERDTHEDGYLTMREIAELSLESDFVNLSACETGLGKIYGGEGVVGLTQAFLVAGTKGLSVSLWQVADESTMRFMTGFYKLTEIEGLGYSIALAEMKREFIKDPKLAAPFFWAPFVYYGE